MNFLILGGMEVGDIDVGYGTARAFSSQQVAAIDAALEPIGDDELRRRYDPTDMMKLEIYPEIWADDPDGGFAYCAEYFDYLKKFIERAAGNRHGIIVYLS